MPGGHQSPDFRALHAEVGNYYTNKVLRHGPTPRGVDWACELTQELRFIKLLQVCAATAPFSLNDLGCGYGALLGVVQKRLGRKTVDYFGVDLSPEMIASARQRWPRHAQCFAVSRQNVRDADYSVASGVFNVKLDFDDALWEHFVAAALDGLWSTSRLGFAVNFLAPAAATETATPQLYRPAPDFWPGYCGKYPGNVEVVRGYGLNEYTVLVRRRSTGSQPASAA